jgi:hypothetical protein
MIALIFRVMMGANLNNDDKQILCKCVSIMMGYNLNNDDMKKAAINWYIQFRDSYL